MILIFNMFYSNLTHNSDLDGVATPYGLKSYIRKHFSDDQTVQVDENRSQPKLTLNTHYLKYQQPK